MPDNLKFGDVSDLGSLIHAIAGNVMINLATVYQDEMLGHHAYFETNVTVAQKLVRLNQKVSEKLFLQVR